MKQYELMPSDGRKSFYRKAIVKIAPDGVETLYSYNTPIIRKMPDGELIRLWGDWSVTTGRHIFSFCKLGKNEFLEMEVA